MIRRALASPFVGYLLAALFAALMLACPAPAPPAPRVGTTAFVVHGRVIAKPRPNADGEVHIVLLGPGGVSYRLHVLTFTRAMAVAGRSLVSGDSVTAWCQVAEGDSVADSLQVERAP